MTFHPKAICLDMDGTLLNNYNEITKSTIDVIQKVREKGIRVFIVTGRTYNEVFDSAPKNLELDGFVTANGMITYVNNEKLAEYSLPTALAESVVQSAGENGVYYEAHPNDGERLALIKDRNYMTKMMKNDRPEEVGLNEWLERKAAIEDDLEWKKELPKQKYAKIYTFHANRKEMEAWILQLEEMKQSQNFTTSSSTKNNVEVMVEGVNKATGIEVLLNHYQISPRETMAIGDSNNDIPMMKFIEYPIAMKNATKQIKQIVKETIEYTNEEEGVRHYLEQLLQHKL